MKASPQQYWRPSYGGGGLLNLIGSIDRLNGKEADNGDIHRAGTVMVRVGSIDHRNGMEAVSGDNVSIEEARHRKPTAPAADDIESSRERLMVKDRSRRFGLTSKIVQPTTGGKKLTSWLI